MPSWPGARIGWLMTGMLAAAILARAGGMISQASLDLVGLLSLGWVVFRVARRPDAITWMAAAAAIGLIGGLAAVRLSFHELRYMPFLLIIPANLVTFWVFVSGLRPGREPILLRLIGLMGARPVDDPRFRRFISRQCLLWAGLSLTTACVALAALVLVGSHPWLAELLGWLFAAQATWFILSHHYASLRYGRPEGWWTTARAMMRSETWSRLRAS